MKYAAPVDIWSLAHVGSGIVGGWLLATLFAARGLAPYGADYAAIAFGALVGFELVECRYLKRLSNAGGMEGVANVVADVLFGALGVLLWAAWLRGWF